MADSLSGWRQARAILQLPFVVAVVVPACALILDGPRLATWPGWLLGVPLMLAGLALMVATIRLFARIGRGTLAPWDPTSRLVVAGPYRHTRNPMITGVCAVLLGEALVFGSVGLFAWFCAFVAINLVYIPLVEAPRMRERFGADYDEYATNVPAWIPRRTPWEPPP